MALHLALTSLFEETTRGENLAFIDELIIQVDNFIDENYNYVLLGYLGSLISRDVVGRAEVIFMMVGHMYIKLDPFFSWCVVLRSRLRSSVCSPLVTFRTYLKHLALVVDQSHIQFVRDQSESMVSSLSSPTQVDLDIAE